MIVLCGYCMKLLGYDRLNEEGIIYLICEDCEEYVPDELKDEEK